jgi:hypothetical protein
MIPRLVTAVVVSAAFVLSAPFMGQIRAALRSAFPGRFVLIVGAAVAAAVAAALVAAVVRIRTRRGLRFGAITLALVMAVAYSVVSRTGVPDADAVERVHFIEYGLMTFLFYRAWKATADTSSIGLPILAGVIVGTLDEWLQWFIPVRVGEARDVLLNLVAITCGLLFSLAIDPPESLSFRLGRRSRRMLCLTAAATVVVFAAFVHAVHLGYLVPIEPFGQFRSHYTSSELRTLAADRTMRWRADPPLVLKRLSREDQYMDEGLWHIRRRNERWAEQDFTTSWRENAILEMFFAPVLDTPSYVTLAPSRWPPEQRSAALERSDSSAAFLSVAEPYPILTWSKAMFWLVAGAVAGGLVVLGGRPIAARRA